MSMALGSLPYLVASLDQFGDDMTTSLSTAAGEHDSLAASSHSREHAVVCLSEGVYLANLASDGR
jgi:hypothetical protein